MSTYPLINSRHSRAFHGESNALYIPVDVHNPNRRCPVALVLDTSSSMSGQPIAELQKGVDLFLTEIQNDPMARRSVELTMITFGGVTRTVFPFQGLNGDSLLCAPSLIASGGTPMGGALELAAAQVGRRKETLKTTGIGYYQPWIVLLTDGQPTDCIERAASLIRPQVLNDKMVFMGIGIGEGADLDVVNRFCHPEFPARTLDGLNFRDLFRWLSQTLRTTTQRTPVAQIAASVGQDEELLDFTIDLQD